VVILKRIGGWFKLILLTSLVHNFLDVLNVDTHGGIPEAHNFSILIFH
jgi:hypothetical protein